MQNKNEGNENKIMLGDLNCTMAKLDRDGENKTQRLSHPALRRRGDVAATSLCTSQ